LGWAGVDATTAKVVAVMIECCGQKGMGRKFTLLAAGIQPQHAFSRSTRGFDRLSRVLRYSVALVPPIDPDEIRAAADAASGPLPYIPGGVV
jgi:hypothetical protein